MDAPCPTASAALSGGGMTFDVASCRAAAEAGWLDAWIHDYLQGGPWTNPGLSAGLRRRARFWIGPVLLDLHALERCCGPEPHMEYRVDAEGWRRKVTSMAGNLIDPLALPPLISEWRLRHLSVRDGSHRLAAASLAGWPALWVVVWYDDPAEGDAVRRAVAAASSAAPLQGRPRAQEER